MISQAQIEELVRLYDQFHGAFNPLLPEVLAAEHAFFEKLQTLHATHAADVPFHEFRRYAVMKCKEYLRHR
jgi:hypothetical protein